MTSPWRGPSTSGQPKIRHSGPLDALNQAIDRVTRAGESMPCTRSKNPLAWISDKPAEQVMAATACLARPCPVLELCAAAGERETGGVWGGRLPEERS